MLWGGANDYISKEPFTGEIGTLLDTPEGRAGYKRIVNEAVAARAFFWDVVHPTSYTHCWVAFFVERELARAGLLARQPAPEEHRAFCEARAARAS